MSIETQRHSAAHLMAAAIRRLFPDAKFGVGPAIEFGFYYDIDIGRPVTAEDIKAISKEMKKMISQNPHFEREEMGIDEAIALFEKMGQTYKVELLKDLKERGTTSLSEEERQDIADVNEVSLYKTGDFVDLCRGPHVESANEIGAWKLTKFSGAYWRGDEKNAQMQRIYGVCFATQEELDRHLKMLEEAEKRDHRKLGQALGLFMFDDEVGAGLPLWLPNGAVLRNEVMNFAFQTYLKNGYEPVCTPHIAHASLWSHSGHLDFYGDSMYGPVMIDEEEYRIKPMNCPFHVKMYQREKRSYRDLPIRWTEMGTVYRYERSGTLHGLTRVRGFTQDDAHIVCTPEQLEDEVKKSLEMTRFILSAFGFSEYEMNLSVRDPEHPDKFIGDGGQWKLAEDMLKRALEESGFGDYAHDVGGAVFYGPKIDVKVADSIGRKWQLSTIQFDFNLPERFGMTYVGQDGKEHAPFMIHRAILGSLERFIGVLIEHYAGAFPAWLSPVQVRVIPVADRHNELSYKLRDEFLASGMRADADDATESVGKKIRNAELMKIPYMVVAGDKEAAGEALTVRVRGEKDQVSLDKAAFIERLRKEIEERLWGRG
jgi:threonyl-tRNA synthetase